MANEAQDPSSEESKKAPEPAGQEVDTARRGPISALPRFEQELERFLGNRFPWRFNWPPSDWHLGSELGAGMPSVDVIEREDEIVVRAEVPGFKREDIEVSLADDRMTIKASTESTTESDEEDGEYHRREIRRGQVSRTVTLPNAVIADDAKARLDDGVLEVTVPKAQKTKRQTIEIAP